MGDMSKNGQNGLKSSYLSHRQLNCIHHIQEQLYYWPRRLGMDISTVGLIGYWAWVRYEYSDGIGLQNLYIKL